VDQSWVREFQWGTMPSGLSYFASPDIGLGIGIVWGNPNIDSVGTYTRGICSLTV